MTTAAPLARYSAMGRARFASGSATPELHHHQGHDPPAPWLHGPSATPIDRWYAEYSSRELTAPAIQRAYAALQIPPDHIRVFSRDLPASFHGDSPNPYHVITIRDPAYVADWRAMFGEAR